MGKLRAWLDTTRFGKFLQGEKDRTVFFSAAATPISFLLALIKLGLGLVYFSIWLLGFGLYYLVLVLAKFWLFYRYTRLRQNGKTLNVAQEYREVSWGGLLFSGLGLIFAAFCSYMFLHGYSQRFGYYATLTIATIGFFKLISAIVSLVRARRHNSPLISLLKMFSLVDGLVAIVLTQYAILNMKHSSYANLSAGLFGFVIGLVLVVVGLIYTLVSRQRGRQQLQQ